MNTLKIIYLSVIIIFLSGCTQKIPTHDTGYGLVAIPCSFINKTSFSIMSTYEFRSSTDAQFSIKIKQNMNHKDVVISEAIKMGTYTVDAIIIKNLPQSRVSSAKREYVHKIEPPFEINVYDGEIVLIPFVFEVKQYQESETIYCIPRTFAFDDELEEFYSDKLKNKKNVEQWKIKVL